MESFCYRITAFSSVISLTIEWFPVGKWLPDGRDRPGEIQKFPSMWQPFRLCCHLSSKLWHKTGLGKAAEKSCGNPRGGHESRENPSQIGFTFHSVMMGRTPTRASSARKPLTGNGTNPTPHLRHPGRNLRAETDLFPPYFSSAPIASATNPLKPRTSLSWPSAVSTGRPDWKDFTERREGKGKDGCLV